MSSNGSWSVATGAGWLSASPSSGTGNGSFILSATDNNTGSSRSTSVTVSSGQAGVSAAHVAVSQGSGPNLGSVAIYNAVMPGQVPTLTINANATYCDFKIDSTGAWQITSDVAWLTEYMSGQWTGSSAANGRSVYAAVSPNTTGVQRVGHLTIKLTAWPNITATFTITQNA